MKEQKHSPHLEEDDNLNTEYHLTEAVNNERRTGACGGAHKGQAANYSTCLVGMVMHAWTRGST